MSSIKSQNSRKLHSFRELSKIPFGGRIKEIVRKLAILLQEQPELGVQFLHGIDDMFEDLIERYYSENQTVTSKGKYVAIVGDMQLSNKEILEIASTYNFSKSNIRICRGYEEYKNGKYTNTLKSEQCIAVIFGAIPHSAKKNIEEYVENKSIYATNQSGKLKLTKESLRKAFEELQKKI